MNTQILIVEDQFIEANNLRDILKNTDYSVSPLDVAWYLHQQKMQLTTTDAPDPRKNSPVNPAAGKQIIGKSSAIRALIT